MRYVWLALWGLGCAAPSQPPDDLPALLAIQVEWGVMRGWTSCSGILELEIVAMDDLSGVCHQPAESCLSGDTVYVREQPDPVHRAAQVMHEATHRLRTCWAVYDGAADLDRWHTGQTDSCRIQQADDRNHCDQDIWGRLQERALCRWAAWQGYGLPPGEWGCVP